MPLAEDDQRRVNEAEAEAAMAGATKLLVRDPTESQKLSPFTVVCIVANRMIGSGIYVSPAIVLRQTGSVGASLLLWTLGVLLAMCGLMVFLELGLSVPKFQLPESPNDPPREGERPFVNVPRNGGAKNYLEYIYNNPRIRTTCMYGIIFVILGNRAGNALVMGTYIMKAAGRPETPSEVRGIAASVLTVVCIIHAAWRKGGIHLNNILAVVKVSILVAIIAIGFAALGGASFGHGKVAGYTIHPDTLRKTSNFDVQSSFNTSTSDAASFVSAYIQITYTMSGFDQPFYILSEVSRPKKRFAKTAISAVTLMATLYILVNVAYLCVVSNHSTILGEELDMATLFFRETFRNEVAERVMSGIIALSIFGNIFITTFTAGKVIQEIAKEGILPFSKFFAKSTPTLYAWTQRRWFPSKAGGLQRAEEQSSAPALLLHWFWALLLLAVTSGESVDVAYRILVNLYTYPLVIITGVFLAGGLLYLRWSQGEEWTSTMGFPPWGGPPMAAIVYCLACAFALVGAFIPPTVGSPAWKEWQGLQWYIVPSIGLGTLLIGYAYYFVFHIVIPRRKRQERVWEREPVIVRQFGEVEGEWVQALELVRMGWASRNQPSDQESLNGS